MYLINVKTQCFRSLNLPCQIIQSVGGRIESRSHEFSQLPICVALKVNIVGKRACRRVSHNNIDGHLPGSTVEGAAGAAGM